MPKKFDVRKTKIVATLGPACDNPEILKKMMFAGMNVVRLNLSHGSYIEQQQRLDRVRTVAIEIGANIAVMVDTRGIEIRTGLLEKGAVELESGSSFTLYTDDRIGNTQGVSITNKTLPKEVQVGEPILFDDGAIELEITKVNEDSIQCRLIHGGILHEHKSVNLPDTQLAASMLSPEYREDIVKEIKFAAENDVDYLAASFMQCAEDVRRLREIMQTYDRRIPIISKIENKAGVINLEKIVAESDGIMVARGDLGVELPLADVPGTQKQIICTTVQNGKPVITATEMLASMERNPRPTRAEASDVANAILDGTSAVMLSGETAIGNYPVETVMMMSNLALRAEESLGEYGFLQKIKPNPSNRVTEAVSDAATSMANKLNAAAIFTLTESGFTSRLISKHRPECPILAITCSRLVARRLALNWGVTPILYKGKPTDDDKIEFAMQRAMELGYIESGDVVISTSGHHQQSGGTDLIRVLTAGACAL
jgi:pyruvate kinase